MSEERKMSRRTALKMLGIGAIGVAALNFTTAGCAGKAAKGGKLKPIAYRKDRIYKDKVSLLAYGGMRFPRIKNEEGRNVIDRAIAEQLITKAYESGINYFDTAYNYLGGESELVFGEIMKKFPRESFFMATKMPTWLVTDLEKGKALFQEQLDKLQMEYLDFYLLHAISSIEDFTKAYLDTGVLEYLKEEKAKGRIKRLGFSFHGNEKTMDFLLEQYNWDFVMIQLNYLDWEAQNAKYMYEQLEKHNIQVNVMEPLRGGALATLNPEAVGILKEAHPDWTPASWAFRYVASLPNVLTILSGMTDVKYIEENVNTLRNFKPLTDDERAVLAKALEAYRKITPVPCTGCAYCMPCDFGVDIPAVFATFNELVAADQVPDINGPFDEAFETKKAAFLAKFDKEIPEPARPSHCTQCGKCAKQCPQEIAIPEELKRINNLIRMLSR